ncbi:hypothetical protein [Actinomadura citrea]|uniref:Uncharacterized protein n=1 Tax=Actinomadura citrea TaxID=46158 RepID=A0A7Y9KIY1_9ACTN|nr:hypothetical protein [Actinomadura citrea]NYE17588.1 hypothetical protein [Actinomadura citrea]GGU03393.1 hypothetical protein GCM10010177_73500 [Actinomadura citrea]
MQDGAQAEEHQPNRHGHHLRTRKITLTCEPEDRTLRTGTPKEVKINIERRR